VTSSSSFVSVLSQTFSCLFSSIIKSLPYQKSFVDIITEAKILFALSQQIRVLVRIKSASFFRPVAKGQYLYDSESFDLKVDRQAVESYQSTLPGSG
jgi:hypothetical protein